MKLQIIDTGYFYADGGAMFGAIPKRALEPSLSERRDKWLRASHA